MSIKAIKDNAKFISKVYIQEASDTDWAKAKPKVKFKYKETNVLDSSTTSELIVSKSRSVSEGDIIVVNDNGIKKKILQGSDILIENLVDNPDPFGDNSGVALWQLDGNANDTGGRYNGTWRVTEQYDTGKFGRAGKFVDDGRDYNIFIKLNESASFKTLSFWYKEIRRNKDDFKVMGFNIRRQQTQSGGNNYFTPSFTNTGIPAPDEIGIWYHVVCSLNSDGKAYIYRNGNLLGSINEDVNNYSTDRLIYAEESDNNNWVILVDQVRIFNRALTDEEVQILYAEEALKFNVSDLNLSQTPQKIWIIDGSIITTKGGSTTTKLVLPPNNVKLFDTLIVNDGAEKEIIVRSVERDSNGDDVVQLGQELALVPSEVAKVDVPEVIVDVEPTEQELLVDDIELEKESSTKTQFVGASTKNVPISAGMEVILDNKAIVTSDVNIENTSIVDKVDPFGDNSGVALYQFEGNANDTGGRYNGTWQDAEQYDTGKFGRAAKFARNGHIDVGRDTFRNLFESDFSITGWIKPLSSSEYTDYTSGDLYFAFRDELGGVGRAGWDLRIVENNLQLRVVISTDSEENIEISNVIDLNKWYFVCIIRQGNDWKIVLNCTYSNNKNISSYRSKDNDWPAKTNGFGGYKLKNGKKYGLVDGYIDQVRIFNRALTDEEVQTLYKYELKHKCTLEFPEQPQAPQTCLVPAKGKRVKLTPLQMSYDESSNTLLKEAQEFEKTGRALQYAIKSPKDVEIDQLNIDLWKRQ